MSNTTQDYPYNRREQRQQRREQRRSGRGGAGWLGGIAIILLGLILLAQNMNILIVQNWWALFILLPALGSFTTAWRMIQSNEGHFTKYARAAIISGVMFTLAAGMFLFNLNWTLMGPLMLVLAGISLLVNAIIPE